MPPPTYTFGDSDLAARRLFLVAETFADTSAAFMRESVTTRPRLAADLGCGPGYTTHLVADTLKPTRTVGLDNSENFLANVYTNASDSVSFHLHDITTGPFPEAPFDLIFSRLVLTHLRDPWRQSRYGRASYVPEDCCSSRRLSAFTRKSPPSSTTSTFNEAMLITSEATSSTSARASTLITASGKMHRRASDVRSLHVPARSAAEMFHMNLGVWRHNDFVLQTYASTTLDALEQDLQAIAQGHTHTSSCRMASPPDVEWRLRQIVIERV